MRGKAPATGLAATAGLGAFAVALIAALIVLAPATLIDARLRQASDGRLRLAEVEGSVWSGAGWIEIRDADHRVGIARHVEWRVRPAALLRGQLVAEVVLDQAAQPFPVTLSLARFHIRDAALSVPAAALGLGVPTLAPLRLTGDLLLDISHFSLERGRLDGEATLRWHAAGSALTRLSPLGDYEMRVKAVGGEVNAVLSTLEGPLQLDGKGSWSPGEAPRFLATARVPAQHQEQLTPLLRLIAIQRGEGSFELSSNQRSSSP